MTSRAHSARANEPNPSSSPGADVIEPPAARDSDVRWIDSPETLAPCLAALRHATWLALDTEADSLHAYPEKLCLIQIAFPERVWLIDPLSGLDLAPLWAELQTHELLLHGGDYDLRLLWRTGDFTPRAVFDTMLAARLLGCAKPGLTDLARHYLGVHLEKGPQRANWARRPLSDRLQTYAANDVRHLEPLVRVLRDALERQGRLEWHRQTCARLITDCRQARARDPEQAWRMGGQERLSRRGLAALRALWHWREHLALRTGKPPYFVLGHEALLLLAEAADQARHPLPWPRHISVSRRQHAEAAISQALSHPPHTYPTKLRSHSPRMTETQRRRLVELQQRRDQRARELELDPALIASRAALLTLCRAEPAEDGVLLPWQRQLLGL